VKRFLYLLLSISFFTNLYAQNYTLKFEKFDNYPDVPYAAVQNIVQDSVGFIWLQTEYELFRFDGNKFISFSKFQQESDFPSGTIFITLYIDSRQILWVGTNKGVFMRNDTLDYFKQVTPSISLNESNIAGTFRGIVEDTVTGKYYFLAENGVIYSYERDGSFKSLLNLELTGCKFITIDSKQNLWIASSNKIFKYNINNNFTQQINLDSWDNIELIEITELLIEDSILYVTAYKSDLIKYNLNTGKTEFLSNNVNQNTYCLLKDKAGFIWIGSSLGLKCLNPVTNTLYIYSPSESSDISISSQSIRCLLIDRQENFWVGTENGLNISYHLKKFKAFGKKFGNVPFSCDVSAITSDYKGNIWLGCRKGGIHILDPDFNIIESIDSFHGLKPNEAISEVNIIYEDEERSMWIGTYQSGLILYNPNTKIIRQFFPDQGTSSSIQGSFIISICEDKKENFWLAIQDCGIEYFLKDEGIFTHFLDNPSKYPMSISNNWPFSIILDSKDNLWVGSTYGAVCYDLNTGIYRDYNTESEIGSKLSNNYVSTIYEDSDHRIWLGTSYGLDVIFNDQITRIISTSDGLSSNQIRSIMEDCKGDIWIGTINGLNKITEITGDKLAIETYYKEDGLHSNCFLRNSVYKSDDGHLYFGGIDGYTVFHPDSIEYNREPPKVVFTEFKLFNKNVGVIKPGQSKKASDNQFHLDKNIQYLNKIILSEKQNLISFSFTSLNYINPSKNQYAFKLEGFDQNWIYSGNRYSAEYSNLRPGDYTLLVKATNNDGVWCEANLSMDIEVIPSFWKSRFASILYIILLISIIFLIIKTEK
jgi:ligand-binding sensor domain-containing protein